MIEDIISRADEAVDGKPLLCPTVRSGKLVGPLPGLRDIHEHNTAELASLSEHLRRLEPSPAYPVTVTSSLLELADEVDRQTMISS